MNQERKKQRRVRTVQSKRNRVVVVVAAARRQRGCELPTELRLHAWYNLCLEAAAFSRLPLLAWRWRLPVSDVDTKTATTTT